jgi:hypothetical protein
MVLFKLQANVRPGVTMGVPAGRAHRRQARAVSCDAPGRIECGAPCRTSMETILIDKNVMVPMNAVRIQFFRVT